MPEAAWDACRRLAFVGESAWAVAAEAIEG